MKKIAVASFVIILALFTIPFYSYQESLTNILVNGRKIDADVKMIGDRTYIPLRAVSEAMGAEVGWDENTSTANISLKNYDELIPEVISQVSPSVVGIIGDWKDESSSAASKYREGIVHGTGVIVGQNGQILTNAHVVKEMGNIVVVLADGSGYQATLRCIDEDTDLALVTIEKDGLPAAKFGSQEDIISGKTVIAIGTPVSFSLRNSASTGIISGINRGIDSQYRLIQTDAAINPGNSGGPLVNLKGEIIGINSSKYAGVGIEGMGFSIPVHTVHYVMDQFAKYGKVNRPYMGIEFEESWAARVGLPADSGLTVQRIENTSPAQAANMKEGDIVISINDVKVNSIIDVNEEMKKYIPGDSIMMKFKRDGVIQNVGMTLGENK